MIWVRHSLEVKLTINTQNLRSIRIVMIEGSYEAIFKNQKGKFVGVRFSTFRASFFMGPQIRVAVDDRDVGQEIAEDMSADICSNI